MEIPVLHHNRTVGTHKVSVSREREDRCKRRRRWKGKTVHQSKDVKRSEKEVAKYAGHVPRKAAIVYDVPVPKTDTGGWGEDPKAGGRSIVKELGKMAP